MKGYVIFTTERNLIVKDKEKLDTFEPHFWSTNRDYIMKKWEFDTDDIDSVKRIVIYLKGLDRRVLPQSDILMFLTQIGVNVEDLKRGVHETRSDS